MWGTLLSIFLFLDTSFDEGTENGGRKAEEPPPLVFVLCKMQAPCSSHGLWWSKWWEKPVLMFEAGESWTLFYTCLRNQSESRDCCFLLAVQPAPGTTTWRQRSDLVSPFIWNERQPSTDLAIWELVCSMQLFQQFCSSAAVCFLLSARMLPYLSLFCSECPMPNCMMQKFQSHYFFWMKPRWFLIESRFSRCHFLV